MEHRAPVAESPERMKALREQRERKGGPRRSSSLRPLPSDPILFPLFLCARGCACLPKERRAVQFQFFLIVPVHHQNPAQQTSRKGRSLLARSLGATASGEEAVCASEKVLLCFVLNLGVLTFTVAAWCLLSGTEAPQLSGVGHSFRVSAVTCAPRTDRTSA